MPYVKVAGQGALGENQAIKEKETAITSFFQVSQSPQSRYPSVNKDVLVRLPLLSCLHQEEQRVNNLPIMELQLWHQFQKGSHQEPT